MADCRSLGYPDGWNNLAYVNNRITGAIDWLGGYTYTVPNNTTKPVSYIANIYNDSTVSFNGSVAISFSGGDAVFVSATLTSNDVISFPNGKDELFVDVPTVIAGGILDPATMADNHGHSNNDSQFYYIGNESRINSYNTWVGVYVSGSESGIIATVTVGFEFTGSRDYENFLMPSSFASFSFLIGVEE